MEVAVINDQSSTRTVVERGVRALLSDKLQLEAAGIAGTATLGDLGFDSLGLSDLAEAIEDRFDVQMPNRTLPATLTIDQLVGLLSRNHSISSVAAAAAAEPAD